MPIVDIRNQPTVIEFVPENSVVEFTEEQVTAQVVVGPTVVEFSWGELVPGPGLKGGGVFEGTVYIDQDIPGLPATVEAPAVGDLFMMWDESQQQHVKIPAFDGGGDPFAVANVGTGAQVHKITEVVSSIETAKLRTFLGEDGITVTQTANEIVIGNSNATLGSGPSVGAIESSAIGCGTSITLTPSSQLPTSIVGDLMVMVLVTHGGVNNGATFNVPTGWNAFRHPKYRANAECSYISGVYWKFVTSADLTSATHTFTNNGSGAQICGYAFSFRNAHPQMPLMGYTSDYNTAQVWYPSIGGISSGQAIVDVLTFFTGQQNPPLFDPGYVTDVGFPPDQYYYQGFNIAGFGAYKHFIGMRVGGISDEQNLIPSETPVSSLAANGWSSSFCIKEAAQYFGNTKLRATTLNSRHYIEFPIYLEAGKKYTFALNQWYTQFNYAAGDEGIGIGYVDPDGVERAYPFRNMSYSGNALDPLGDLGTSVWSVANVDNRLNGVPSLGGSRHVMFLTAQVSGIHKLRISHINCYGATVNWTHADFTNPKYINSVLFREGWLTPNMVWTPFGAVDGDSSYGRIHSWGWKPYTGGFGSNPPTFRFAFAVCPSFDPLPPTKLLPGAGPSPREGGFLDYDRLTLLPTITTGQGGYGASPTYSVYPTLFNVRQSYYFEMKILTPGQVGFGIFANGAAASVDRAVWVFSDNLIYWHDGTQSTPTGNSGQAANDIFGCKIDFTDSANITITFYRNGVAVGSKTAACSANSWRSDSEPWIAFISQQYYGYPWGPGKVKAAFAKGELGYQPTDGTLPYDALGVQPAVNFTGIESTGTGVPLINGSADNPSIKSLIAGTNVTITPGVDDVTISALDKTITLSGVITTAVSGAQSPLSPTGLATASVIRWTPAAAATLYSLADTTDKRLVLILNCSGTYSITVKHDTAYAGATGQRFTCPGAVDFVIPPYGGILAQYTAGLLTYGRWQIISTIGGVGSGTSLATDTLWDTKGDLVVATGADTAAKLPIGIAGQTLTPDPSQATGMKWVNRPAPIIWIQEEDAGDSFFIPGPPGPRGAAGVPGNGSNSADGAEISRIGVAQSIPHATYTPVQFDTEVRDDGDYAILGTYDDRLTVTNTGWYVVSAVASWIASPVGTRYAYISKNGSTTAADLRGSDLRAGVSGSPISQPITTVLYLTAGDYVQLMVQQTSGAALNTDTTFTPKLAMHRIGVSVSSSSSSVNGLAGPPGIDGLPGEDAIPIPGPPGPKGDPGITGYVMLDMGGGGDVGDSMPLFGPGAGASTGGGSSTLAGLADVNISSPANGNALVWDSATSRWIPGATGSGGGGGGVAFSGASITYASNTAQAAGSYWAFNTAQWDTDGYWSAGDPTKLTVPAGAAGKYLVTVTTDQTTGWDSEIQVFVNGTIQAENYPAGAYSRANTSVVLDLAAGDYLQVKHGAGTPTLNAGRTRFQITRMSGAYLQPGVGVTHVDAPPVSPTTYDDEFEGSVLNSKWTWQYQASGATAIVANGALKLQSNVSSARTISAIYQAVSGSAWKYRSKLSPFIPSSINYTGMYLIETGTGKALTFGWYASAGVVYLAVLAETNNNPATGSATVVNSNISGAEWGWQTRWTYMEIELAAGTLYFRVSQTGEDGTFYTFATAAVATYFTTGVTGIGFHATPISATTAATLAVDWFRQIGSSYAPGKLIVNGSQILPHTVQGRLTLTSGTPVTTSDITGATSVYFTPYNGNTITLWDGSAWVNKTFTETTLALGTITSGKPYDVFGYLSSGVLALEMLVWTNDTTRATAVTLQDGRYCKSGDKTRLLLGTFYTTATTTTEDSLSKRYLFNQYNRVKRHLANPLETTDSWTYTTTTWRQARASATNQFEYVNGDPGHYLSALVRAFNSGSTVTTAVGIGIDSTTINSARYTGFNATSTANAGTAEYKGYPGIGRHYVTWLEISQALGTTTWFGDVGLSYVQTGIFGEVDL